MKGFDEDLRRRMLDPEFKREFDHAKERRRILNEQEQQAPLRMMKVDDDVFAHLTVDGVEYIGCGRTVIEAVTDAVALAFPDTTITVGEAFKEEANGNLEG